MRFLECFLLLASGAYASTAADCDNSNLQIVSIRRGVFRLRRRCAWVASFPRLCTFENADTGQEVGMTCAKECPEVSGCPAVSPTMSPTKNCPGCHLPTKSPTGAPKTTYIPTSSPSLSNKPTHSFDGYPAGPYITTEIASEVIALPEPEAPDLSGLQDNCPHNDSGLLDWHNESTWGGTIPVPGQDITLPANIKVLVSQSVMGTLGLVTVPQASELVIGEKEDGISIDATGFEILGNLTVGSESCRIATPVVITLHGVRPVDAVGNRPDASVKGISVKGGTLNLHGKRYSRTWTRLAKSVSPGDRAIAVQHSVNWEVGQEIVLVTSAIKDSRDYNQNEVRTIEAVHPDPPEGAGAIVYLSEAVEHAHIANSNYQVEVGLLSRMIKIQGAPDSEPSDPDPLDRSCMDERASRKWQVYYNTTMPCMDKELTGYGGHVMVHQDGIGQVAGVELFRMGQTNVLGRYPMHFHLLGDCPSCYFTDSSVHRSFYRCISIHGTNNSTVTENVAYDVTGYCYYLEDGVEQDNKITFNLAAHIHTIGPNLPWGSSQTTTVYEQGPDLTLPADTTASGFYITNVHNYIEGNAASGGWAGFAFPSLPTALQGFRDLAFRPSNAAGLKLDGNTAHSTGWWWSHAGAFYFGGALYYNDDDMLEYNPGRSKNFGRDSRRPCNVNSCAAPFNNCGSCPDLEKTTLRMTNSKAFLTAGVGLNSWTGEMEVIGFESHDARLAIESLSNGFWIDNMLAVCRTGEDLNLPVPKANKLNGDGFVWYDTGQSHIITDSIFRNCGYRSDEFDQYDTSPNRGCDDDKERGCSSGSSVFGFLTHSDQFTPEVMQGTRNITFDNCGRRFKFSRGLQETVSGRGQNWLDVDGSVSGLDSETMIGSGLEGAKDWWQVEDEVVLDEQAPLVFIKKAGGPQRSIAHFRMRWDALLHGQVGTSLCGNGNSADCPPEGYIRHLGKKFSPFVNPESVSYGLPVTANPDVVGPTGGFGWLLTFNQTAPRFLTLDQMEIDPASTLMLTIPYPDGSSFDIRAKGPKWCRNRETVSCEEVFTRVDSLSEVRRSLGNTYHVDGDGVMTLRVVQFAQKMTGNPDWFVPTYDSPGLKQGELALPRFERDGVLLPDSGNGRLEIRVTCPSDTVGSPTTGYCPETVKEDYDPTVCGLGWVQKAFDKCCKFLAPDECQFADGSSNY